MEIVKMTANAKDSLVSSRLDKTRELIVECEITANATPANKVHSSDIPGTLFLRTEGKVSEADAIEDLSGDFTTAADNATGNSVFGIVIKGENLPNNGIDKVLDVEIKDQNGDATSLTVTPAQASYLTSGGNIAIDIAGTGLNLASESPVLLVKVVYREL